MDVMKGWIDILKTQSLVNQVDEKINLEMSNNLLIFVL
jgi:hypothetical protein